MESRKIQMEEYTDRMLARCSEITPYDDNYLEELRCQMERTLRESESPKSKGTTLKLGVRLKHVRFVPLTVLLTL